MSNFLLTRTDEATKQPAGVAVDLGRELARRVGVPVQFVPYPNPGVLADAAKSGVWDVGFLGAEPQRANEIDFMNGFIVDKGKALGIPTPSHAKLVELVRKLERGEIRQSPSHLGG
jgi:polar amino acid transport system substrate-binding protein